MSYFEVLKSDSGSKARTGLIHTAHGDIKTPAFLPIGTKGAVKSITSEELKFWGADIILLIAAILTPLEIKQMAAVAKGLGLNVLLEVHNLAELERSIDPNLTAIGVNNRNLADFTVSVDTSFQLYEHIPQEFLKISESAISNTETIKKLKAAGFNGFLIGENFMKEADPGAAIREFVKDL